MANGVSVWDQLAAVFAQYGLTDLVNTVKELTMNTTDPDEVKLQKLYDSKAYTTRFPAMKEIQKKAMEGVPGYRALSPDEYIRQEQAYAKQLRDAGLPAGFYDDANDFAEWMKGAVSPDEVAARAQLAIDMTDSADQSTKDALYTLYGLDQGAVAAYFLDPQRMQGTLAEAERKGRAAQLAGAAAHAGFDVDSSWKDRSEQLATQLDPKATYAQMQAGYDTVASDAAALPGLNQRYGTDLTIEDSEDANLLGLASAQRKRAQLDESERNSFKGGSGVGSSSLSERTTGNL